MRKAAQAWLQYGRDLNVVAIEHALSEIDDENERLRAYIWSLDGKHVGIRTGDTFIDETVIVAADILEVRRCRKQDADELDMSDQVERDLRDALGRASTLAAENERLREDIAATMSRQCRVCCIGEPPQ